MARSLMASVCLLTASVALSADAQDVSGGDEQWSEIGQEPALVQEGPGALAAAPGSFTPDAPPAALAPADPPEPDLWSSAFPVLPGEGWTVLGMVSVLLVSLLLVAFVSRLRFGLPVQGVIPSTLGLVHVVLQLFALLTAAGIVARLLPPALEPAVPWAIVAFAVAVGWSSRDVLPDLIGAAVISFERRIRPGIWMSTGELSGLVERRGLRAVWLWDGHGNRIAIPNRQLLNAHVAVQEAAGPVHEVALRVEDLGPTKEVRRALLEATLTSPWVRPDAAPAVRQDGGDPTLWHVRAHLLEMRFAGRFEGDLLERTEDVLAVSRTRAAVEENEAAEAAAPPASTEPAASAPSNPADEREG
ncbi:MAG: mechanosensitive ion channel [Deltaproteobacteria bacterium]|nr:mechanosensitive ion channel [Deltaproteobacteria bacterium]